MLEQNVFAVTNEQLGALDAETAVDRFRELLWAEATTLGIGKNLINVPSAIAFADGGIDAEVRDAVIEGGQGIIKPGTTRYQIKTGHFRLIESSRIDEILFMPSSLKKDATRELQPRIKSCFDKDGTLVIVLFGWDEPETTDDQILDKIRGKLREVDPAYASAKIEIWRQNTIRGFLAPYPSLALRFTGRQDLSFLTHPGWARLAAMQDTFQPDAKQADTISRLQVLLRDTADSVHVRVLGEPGIGKTRLVFEALREPDLAPLVVYCQSAIAFRHSRLMTDLLREDLKYSIVLVIDECSPEDSRAIWNQLRYARPGIKLVTIYHDEESTTGPTLRIDAPPLADETTAKIIQSYRVPEFDTRRWAELCSGSPRVAHVIGANLRSNPEDILREPDTGMVWERFIAGPDALHSAEADQRRVVLRFLALFQRFGFEGALAAEAQQIAALVREARPEITWPRFQEIVRGLRRRRVLQGERTLYITPKAFHIWLWREWWEIHGSGFDLAEFQSKLSPMLRAWFEEMFAYAHASDAARSVVRELLAPGGPFELHDYLRTEGHGPRFFLALTEAEPEIALRFLQRTIGRWSDQELLDFTTGRQEAIWALERIAVWRPLFQDAARLLLRLARSEPEGSRADSSSSFANRFSLGPGVVAPTEAPPSERLPILIEAIHSKSTADRLAALKALDTALHYGDFIGDVGPQQQGLRAHPNLWSPRTWGEWFEAYREVWGLLWERTPTLPEDERAEAVRILLSRARGLTAVANLSSMVCQTLRELANEPYVDKQQVLSAVISIRKRHVKDMPSEIGAEWEQLENDLTGQDFPSLLHRYVGMDLLEDKFDEDGNRFDRVQPQIEFLADQALVHPELLERELPWLLSDGAANAGRFGYALGQRDPDLTLYQRLLAALREAGPKWSGLLVGAYLRALFERDRSRWEAELDALAADAELKSLVPEFTYRADLSDRAAQRLLALARDGTMQPSDFQMLGYSGLRSQLSPDIFQEWIEFLLSRSALASTLMALQLCDAYYAESSDDIIPEDLAERLLLHESLLQPSDTSTGIAMGEYYWEKIAQSFLITHPERGPAVAAKILEHLADDSFLSQHENESLAVLNLATAQRTEEIWPIVAGYLGPPIDRRAWRIKDWLSGGGFFGERIPGALVRMPANQVWAWVNEQVEQRAWYLATFVPNVLFHDPDRICWARELLVRYGDRDDVRNNLAANFSTGGWVGEESDYLSQKKAALAEFLLQETHPHVRRWVVDYIAHLERAIEEARIREEREGF